MELVANNILVQTVETGSQHISELQKTYTSLKQVITHVIYLLAV